MRSNQIIFLRCHKTNKQLIHLCEKVETGFANLQKLSPTQLEMIGFCGPASSLDLSKLQSVLGVQEGWFTANKIAKDWIEGLTSGAKQLDDLYSKGTNPHYKDMPKATSIQWQIITGSLMGAGYLVKAGTGYCFGMTESKDKNWLEYKVSELHGLGNPYLIEDGDKFRWRTRVDAISFDVFLNHHYSMQQKTIRPVSLEQIMDIGLMVWFMDKGFWRTSSTIAFRTSRLDDIGNIAIADFLNSVDIRAEFKKYERSKQITLDQDGTDTFLNLISDRVPQCMEYRLEP